MMTASSAAQLKDSAFEVQGESGQMVVLERSRNLQEIEKFRICFSSVFEHDHTD